MGQGRHVAEDIDHDQVVKNPNLVLFGKFKQRNSYYDENGKFVGLHHIAYLKEALHEAQLVKKSGKCMFFVIMYTQRNLYDKNRSVNSHTVVCTNSILFLV